MTINGSGLLHVDHCVYLYLVVSSPYYYMAGSSQPQHFFAAGCLFADFAIDVIFYPVIKTL